MLIFKAKVSTSTLGSAPGDKMKINGLCEFESSNAELKSKGGNSI